MGQINPFSGAVSISPTRSAAEGVRRSQAQAKQVSEDEAAETVIESPDAIVSISDEQSHQSPGKREEHKHKPEDEDDEEEKPAHLDVTA
jgi:hypothetical protein